MPFAFLATYAPQVNAQGRLRYQPLGKALQEYAGTKNKKILIHLLTPVQRATEKSKLIKKLVESRDIYHPLAWTPQEAYTFLQEAPLYEESGILVRLPDWWRKRARPRVSVAIGSQRKSTLGIDTLLDFNMRIAVGDTEILPSEWEELAQNENGLVCFKNQWIEVDRDKIRQALAHWKRIESQANDGVSFLQAMRLLAGAPADLVSKDTEEEIRSWSQVQAGPWLQDILARLHEPEKIEGITRDQDLHARLRSYQETGVRWLWFLSRLGLGACLADDMGLGKTIQVIALLLQIKEAGAPPSLLVLPASLMANWKAELARFAPSLRTKFIHPSFLQRERLEQEIAPESLAQADLVLTSYSMVHRLDVWKKIVWNLVIVDEAQFIKNPSTKQSQAVKALRAQARIALTGTPVENRLGDLWSIFDFICPGLLGSSKRFQQFTKELIA